MGSHFLLQGIFPTQGPNRGLLHCRPILHQLSHKGSLTQLVVYNPQGLLVRLLAFSLVLLLNVFKIAHTGASLEVLVKTLSFDSKGHGFDPWLGH